MCLLQKLQNPVSCKVSFITNIYLIKLYTQALRDRNYSIHFKHSMLYVLLSYKQRRLQTLLVNTSFHTESLFLDAHSPIRRLAEPLS